MSGDPYPRLPFSEGVRPFMLLPTGPVEKPVDSAVDKTVNNLMVTAATAYAT